MNKTFTHKPLDKIVLEKEEFDDKRYYYCDGKWFPSITTVLGDQTKQGLNEWYERVGEEEANRIKNEAAIRGESLHKIVEMYLNNEPDILTDSKNLPVSLFYKIYPKLNNIDNIRLQEAPLYSKTLKCAGTVDCVADYKSVPSIIDFKTSRKEKKEEWIEDYFLQTTAYSMMLQELYNIKITNLVIIVTIENGWTQVFTDNRSNHIKGLSKVLTEFKKWN